MKTVLGALATSSMSAANLSKNLVLKFENWPPPLGLVSEPFHRSLQSLRLLSLPPSVDPHCHADPCLRDISKFEIVSCRCRVACFFTCSPARTRFQRSIFDFRVRARVIELLCRLLWGIIGKNVRGGRREKMGVFVSGDEV